jgi:hypothetical protein
MIDGLKEESFYEKQLMNAPRSEPQSVHGENLREIPHISVSSPFSVSCFLKWVCVNGGDIGPQETISRSV